VKDDRGYKLRESTASDGKAASMITTLVGGEVLTKAENKIGRTARLETEERSVRFSGQGWNKSRFMRGVDWRVGRWIEYC
jgi:hypothetical protein